MGYTTNWEAYRGHNYMALSLQPLLLHRCSVLRRHTSMIVLRRHSTSTEVGGDLLGLTLRHAIDQPRLTRIIILNKFQSLCHGTFSFRLIAYPIEKVGTVARVSEGQRIIKSELSRDIEDLRFSCRTR